MVRDIFPILEQANKIKKIDDRVAFLQQHQSYGLRTLLQLNYDKRLTSALPEGSPPFKRLPEINNKGHEGFFHQDARKMAYFVENPAHNLTRLKRENLFIEILENLPGPEADLIIACKDRKLTSLYKGITLAVVKKAFPDIIPDEQEA
jgi:hypothetical protein